MIYPELIRPGDKIAILSPATTVREEYIDGAVQLLFEEGFEPVIMPHAKGPASGSYASTAENRCSDLLDALTNPEIKGILCARGGYGCIHLLPNIPERLIHENPKWMIGFSDVSALHALWVESGVVSIHGPMAKHLTEEGISHHATSALLRLISQNPNMDYAIESHPFNRHGEGEGRLAGGNLAVLNSLAGTPYDLLEEDFSGDGAILFIEDISEAIYAVERMLTRLILSGRMNRLKGLIIGQFTEYRPDKNFQSMEEMTDALIKRSGLQDVPIAFGFPTGHVADNLPLVEGAKVRLTVDKGGVNLKTIKSDDTL